MRERGRGQAGTRQAIGSWALSSEHNRKWSGKGGLQQGRRHPQCAHLALSSATSAGNVQRLCAGRLRVLRMREQVNFVLAKWPGVLVFFSFPVDQPWSENSASRDRPSEL